MIRIDENIGNIKACGADPYFVKFVLALSGLTHSSMIDFMTENIPASQQRRLKRNLQKILPAAWKPYWEFKKKDKNRKLTKSLFALMPSPPNPPHRPRDDRKWLAVNHLRNYFLKVTGKPKMSLIADIIGMAYSTLNSRWSEKKNSVMPYIFDCSAVIMTTDDLLKWYEFKKPLIQKSLDTDTPLIDIIKGENKAREIAVEK